MVLTKKSQQITKQDILDRIGSETIYRNELPDMKVGRAMCNVMRKDKNPSFSVFMGEDGHLHHVDYADDRYKGGCIDLVMQKYSITYREAIHRIAKEYGLLEGTAEVRKIEVAENRQLIAQKRHSVIQVVTRSWCKKDIEYWQQYGLMPHHMVANGVEPVKELYINRQRETIHKGELVYVYQYEKGLKIYMPQRQKNEKWKSNISTKTIEGLDKLNGHQKVIVTKSLKDRCTLRQIIPEDIAIISTQNESISAWTDELLEILKGRKVWIGYDNDPPGKQASIRVNNKYPWMKHINVPDIYYIEEGLKDWADVYKVYGPDPIIAHMTKKGII